MSRSYKKTPRAGDRKDKMSKQQANRKIRRQPVDEDIDISSLHHKQYRKNFDSYDICDYETIGESFEEFYQARLKNWQLRGCHYGKPKPTKEQCKKDYFKWYLRK